MLDIRPTSWLWLHPLLVQTSSVGHYTCIMTVITSSCWFRPAVLDIRPASWLWSHPHAGSDQQCWTSDLHHDCDDIIILMLVQRGHHSLHHDCDHILMLVKTSNVGTRPASWQRSYPHAGSDQQCWAPDLHHEYDHIIILMLAQCWTSGLHKTVITLLYSCWFSVGHQTCTSSVGHQTCIVQQKLS